MTAVPAVSVRLISVALMTTLLAAIVVVLSVSGAHVLTAGTLCEHVHESIHGKTIVDNTVCVPD